MPCVPRVEDFSNSLLKSGFNKHKEHTDMVKARPRKHTIFSLPKFFKVYFPHISSQQLRIPPAFIKHFNGVLPNNAILKSCNSKFWNVTVEKVGNDLFFQNGWAGFVKDHSLELGDFLLFSFNGNSVFRVKIFGTNGCQKEVTLDYRNGGNTTSHIKKEEHPEERGTLSELRRTLKRQYYKRSSKKIGKTNCTRSKRTVAAKVEEKKSIETDGFVEPKNPHFTATVVEKNRYRLNIPKKLVTENGVKIRPMMKFRNQSGKLWPVKVLHEKDGRFTITSGWKQFKTANGLQDKDECVFEFIRGKSRKEYSQKQIGNIALVVDCGSFAVMATTSTLSPATFTAAAVVGAGRKLSQRRKNDAVDIGGLNSFGGLKAHNSVASLGLPICTERFFAKVVSTLKLRSKRKGNGGGALTSTCNAAEEIFKIAVIMNALVLVGVAVGFVLLRIEAFVEESEGE